MNDRNTFIDGYRAGWKTIMGARAGVPAVGSYHVPSDKPPYQAGFEKGVADAYKRKVVNSSQPVPSRA